MKNCSVLHDHLHAFEKRLVFENLHGLAALGTHVFERDRFGKNIWEGALALKVLTVGIKEAGFGVTFADAAVIDQNVFKQNAQHYYYGGYCEHLVVFHRGLACPKQIADGISFEAGEYELELRFSDCAGLELDWLELA